MIIHNKELESHDYGKIIYYGNRLLKSVDQKINENTTFEEWKEIIEKNPNFCVCKHSNLYKRSPIMCCSDYPCDKNLKT